MTSKRLSKMLVSISDFPTAVGPKRTTRRVPGSGFRVAIPDLLREDLLERGGDNLALVGIKLIIACKVDLNAALHCRACHLIYIALKALEKVQR